tara:strand:- start:55359 stop:55538 length:180 start_codon:yes stop_codon:yes gene_type:complete
MRQLSVHTLVHKGRHTKPLSVHTLVHKELHMMQLLVRKPAHRQPVRNTMVRRTSQQKHC